MKFRSALSTLLAIGMAAATPLGAVSPVFAADDDETQLGTDDSLYRTKTATLEDDGTYTIDIETYAKGTPQTLVTSKGVPLDIVLVIDQSGSMGNGNKLSTLKTAVYNFMQQVAVNAEEDNITHRIAVTGFGCSKVTDENGGSDKKSNFYYSGTGLFLDGEFVRYDKITDSNYDQAFANVLDTTQADKLNPSLKKLTAKDSGIFAKGATNTDLGMEMAQNILNHNEVTEEGRKQVVVVFSDGSPSYWDNDSIDKTKNKTIANNAISTAKELKDANVTIHSVGILSSSSGKKVLNYISSNYPNATSYSNPGTGNANGVYYHVGSTATDMDNVFEEVRTEILEEVSRVRLDANAVLQDVVAEGFDTSNMEVSAWTVDGTMQNAGKDNETIIWNDNSKSEEGLAVAGDKTSIATVTGFDYSQYFIYGDHSGKKLVVRLTGILPTDATPISEQVLTNGENSGVFVNQADVNAANSGEAVRFFKFEKPDTILTKKAFVVDYAKKLAVPAEQYAGTAEAVTTLGINTEYAVIDENTPSTVEGAFGTYSVEGNGTLMYAPSTMEWTGVDKVKVLTKAASDLTAEYSANAAKNNIWSEVSILPATSVYYEDNFVAGNNGAKFGITYTAGAGNTITVGAPADPAEGFVADDVHGGWDSSMNFNGDSEGASTAMHVGDKATFIFYGTGFDIYSRTNETSGIVTVQLYSQKEVRGKMTWMLKKSSTIDTKSVSQADGASYFNVPTLAMHDLAAGQYKVIVSLGAAKNPDAANTEFRIDGVRVYNPLANQDDAEDNYAGEYNAKFYKAKDLLTTNGQAFIDADGDGNWVLGDYRETELWDIAPLNEIYLNETCQIQLSVGDLKVLNSERTGERFYLGMKSLDGEPVTLTVNGKTYTVNSTVDSYFEVIPDEDGNINISEVRSTNPEAAAHIVALTQLRVATNSK